MSRRKRLVEAKENFEFLKFEGYWDLNDPLTVVQEFDGHANHRLRCGAFTSEWASYRMIAELNIPNVGMFRGTSDFYRITLPKVFQMHLPFTEEK